MLGELLHQFIDLSYTEICSTGDVKLETDGTPYVFWYNQWTPICGHYFWNNQEGAKLFCRKMGYKSGSLSGHGSGQKYATDSFRIGECNSNDMWENCRGGHNDYQIGGRFNQGTAKCDRYQEVKITIWCGEGDSTKTTSCRGIIY